MIKKRQGFQISESWKGEKYLFYRRRTPGGEVREEAGEVKSFRVKTGPGLSKKGNQGGGRACSGSKGK